MGSYQIEKFDAIVRDPGQRTRDGLVNRPHFDQAGTQQVKHWAVTIH